jgi:Outer membrane protein beta-barrel domain
MARRRAPGKEAAMRKRSVWFAGCLLLAALLASTAADAQQVPASVSRAGRFVFGAGLGLQANTVDDTAFAFGLSGDYFFTDHLSIGPLMQFGMTSDLFQFGLSAQAKYTFDLPRVPELKPHLEGGIGFLYANLDKPGSGNKDDTSFLIPLGVGLEYRLSPRLSLDTTAFFNFTDISVKSKDRDFFFTWLLGVKVPF